jgi:Flp pilus assembly pilin Flp
MVDSLIAAVAVRMQASFARRRGEDGQSFVEYVLVLTLLAVGVVVLLQWGSFSAALQGSLQRVISGINGAGQ